MTYQIDIDGFIGDWGYSARYVKEKLNENKNKPVAMRINSNGGSLSNGLSMADRIQEHGDVTVYMMGFNASAATLASLKAKKICMSSNGFYLIHKVMSSVDIWENLNADQMEVLIAQLMVDKLENDKLDQVLAQMYANKTGKSMDEILQLMKKGGWMNAKDALQWGFIDEIIDSPEKVNMISMKEKLNAFGLPTNRTNNEDLFTQKTNIKMKKQPIKINAVLNVPSLESADGGIFLNESQIESIEAQLATQEADIAKEKANVATANTATTAADTRANVAEALVATQKTEIDGLKLQITNKAAGAGDKTNPIIKETDDDDADDDGKSEGFANTIASAQKLYNMIP